MLRWFLLYVFTSWKLWYLQTLLIFLKKNYKSLLVYKLLIIFVASKPNITIVVGRRWRARIHIYEKAFTSVLSLAE